MDGITRSNVGFSSVLNSLNKSPNLRNALFRSWINSVEWHPLNLHLDEGKVNHSKVRLPSTVAFGFPECVKIKDVKNH